MFFIPFLRAGFIDDVEFLFPEPKPVAASSDEASDASAIAAETGSNYVEYRSASRLGDSDFGVNSTRIQVRRNEI